MAVPRNKPQISALLNLLQDDDVAVASLAMEQILNMGIDAEETIAEYQEDNDPRLRSRIHQLSSILARRRARMAFLDAVKNETISLWDGLVEINMLYDPECARKTVQESVDELRNAITQESIDAPSVASFMREQEFYVAEEDVLDVDLYLLERVLATRYGAPALLCAIAQNLGTQLGWHPTVVLFEGRFCLIDRNHLLVDPTDGWHIRKLEMDAKIHPCGRKDVWLGVLSQLFLVSLVEGNLRDLYHFGHLLTSLDGKEMDVLPYPLGDDKRG